MTMKKGEVALVIIAPDYAFGTSEDMNTEEKIEAAGKKKEEGNALFKAGKYVRASKRYEKAVKYIEYDTSFSDEEKKQSKVLKVACNLNSAASLYRRAQAYIQLADLELAEFDIKKALEIDPNNR
ncbi:Peptidyl-prolyl cis-trans isomerase FKBP62 [Linum perenne]